MVADILVPETFLDKNALEELAAQQGPCLTLFLPAYLPGGSQAAQNVTAKALLKSAENRLEGEEFAQLRNGLLDTLEHHSTPSPGGPGIAIFAAPGFQSSYYVHNLPEQVVAGSYFYLVPLLQQTCAHRELFVLTLSTKHLRLFHFDGEKCEQREFPAGVPSNLEEAGQFNRSESGLSSRKVLSASAGGIHFGKIDEPKTGDAYVHDFFATVDRGLQPVIDGRPVLLLGVQEEIAAYRRASVYPELLLNGPGGNADSLRPDEIAALARQAAADDYNRRSLAVLDEYREMPDRHRTAHDIQEILRAAAEGRVHRLCVRESTSDRVQAGSEDLVNAAAVETLRASGQVYAIPRDHMEPEESVAAILRY